MSMTQVYHITYPLSHFLLGPISEHNNPSNSLDQHGEDRRKPQIYQHKCQIINAFAIGNYQ